jgi:hypothetical protein
MSELDSSNIDTTSDSITPDVKLIPAPEQSPPPIPAPTPEPIPAPTPEPTPDNTSDKTFIYDSEPITDIVSNIIEQTFVDLVKKSLENEDMKKQISITLTPEVISVINNIISLSPNTVTDIEKVSIEIIKDGKIDSNDVPNLIVIIQRIYQLIYSLKTANKKTRAETTATILKYILRLLVLERKIKIDEDKQEAFFSQTDLLIDSCIGLLSYSKLIKTKGCFKKLFG